MQTYTERCAAAAEALARAKAALAGDLAAELDGKDWPLRDRHDIAALVEMINEMLRDPAVATRLREAGDARRNKAPRGRGRPRKGEVPTPGDVKAPR